MRLDPEPDPIRTRASLRAQPHARNSHEFLLLGRFVVRAGDQEVIEFNGRKVQELLAYLVLFRGRAHHREPLAETLWGMDSVGPDPKKQLRQALWQLRLAFRRQPLRNPVVRVEGEWL